MLTARAFERFIVDQTPLTATFLDHAARGLRAADLLPSGPRGLYAHPLEVSTVAIFLLGLAASDSPARVPVEAARYAALRPSWSGNYGTGSHDTLKPFDHCETAGAALERVLTGLPAADDIESVEVFRSWPRVVIHAGARTGFYGYAGIIDARAAGFRATAASVRFHFNASLLSLLADALREEADETGALVK